MIIDRTFILSVILLLQGLVSLHAEPEPRLTGSNATLLIDDNSLKGWKAPNDERWSVSNGVIRGDTLGKKLSDSEWIYTENEYDDFVFSVEIKISGEDKTRVNSGIYYRAKIVKWRKTFAPSGYEYDVAIGSLNASIGDYFGRGKKFRYKADQKLVNSVFDPEKYNRFTLRAKGNHIQYWINGTLVNELTDKDERRNLKGLIGIQLHNGMVMKMEMKNAYIQKLKEK